MYVSKEECRELSDAEAVEKALLQVDYFACLYNKYEVQLIRYIRRIALVSSEEAEDILQDAFIKIWSNLNEFDQHLKFSSWIYRIVHNETLSVWRKKKSYGKDRQVQLDDHLFEIGAEDSDADGTMREQKHLLAHDVLEQLPIKYKTVLVLKFLEGMHYDEISDVLKIPEGTVATRINRAKKAFEKIAADQQLGFFEKE